MKSKFIVLVLAVFVLAFGTSFAQEITVDNITGNMWHGQPDSIMTGESYTFNLRYNNTSGIVSNGITNGYRVYSPDGATWTTTVISSTGALDATNFDLIFQGSEFSVTGSNADTVAWGGAVFLSGTGLPADFNDVAFAITIGPIPAGPTHHEQTICLDSSFYPSGTWKWQPKGLPAQFPSWDGPHCFTVVDETTDIEDELVPDVFSLSQNYPNPFNPTTTINYSLATRSDVSLTIYNVTGQKVAEHSATDSEAGPHTFEWDASAVASGIYFYKIVAGDFSDTKKMMLLK